jgi:hypothetical protein
MTVTTNMSEDAILTAARELIARRGSAAKDEAMIRVTRLEQQGNWPEHALALRILTAVERLLDSTGV